MDVAHTRTEQDRHNQFAAGLALLLPSPVPHRTDPSQSDLSTSIIAIAKQGGYALCGRGPGRWPYFFTSPDYCYDLFEAVEKLWRAAYLDE